MVNTQHKQTLSHVLENPVPSDIAWRDIERLIIAVGGEITEGNGSRVRVFLNGVRAVFHHPHPERVTDKGALKSVRRFMSEAGITP